MQFVIPFSLALCSRILLPDSMQFVIPLLLSFCGFLRNPLWSSLRHYAACILPLYGYYGTLIIFDWIILWGAALRNLIALSVLCSTFTPIVYRVQLYLSTLAPQALNIWLPHLCHWSLLHTHPGYLELTMFFLVLCLPVHDFLIHQIYASLSSSWYELCVRQLMSLQVFSSYSSNMFHLPVRLSLVRHRVVSYFFHRISKLRMTYHLKHYCVRPSSILILHRS
jgi:hypothetical protein